MLKGIGRGLIAAVAVLGIARPGLAADPGITDSEITIGLFAPMSGPLAGFGLDRAAGRQDVVRGDQQEGRHPRPQDQGHRRGRQVHAQRCGRGRQEARHRRQVFIVHGGSCTAAAVAAQEFVTREKVPHVMLNASGDSAVIPPTRYVFGAFAGTQRTVGATLAEIRRQGAEGQARRRHRA